MRKPVIGGNWKMNKNIDEGVILAKKLVENLGYFTDVDIFICPPFTILEKISTILKNSHLKLGAQNMHWEEKGAYTGEISADMLIDIGCTYVLLGHSERRRGQAQERDEIINKKIKRALSTKNLYPVLCIGETREERKQGFTEKVIKQQITGSLKGISEEDILNTIIAYEPVWAIGTGDTATPEQAEEIHAYIRKLLSEIYSFDTAEKIRIQYGGSMKPNNAKSLITQNNIDGGLVGGASLVSKSFIEIIRACKT